MANSDDILLITLRQTGAELPSGATSVRELDAAALFGACAACVNAIHEARGEEQRLLSALPANPGVRFRACTQLAAAIASLGYAEELGFNHFLYPNEAESRSLLLFLVDALPKLDATAADVPTAGGGAMAQIRAALQQWRHAPWLPPEWSGKRALPPPAAARVRAALRRAALAAALKAEQHAELERRLARRGEAEEASGEGGFGAPPPPPPPPPAAAAGGARGGAFAHQTLFAEGKEGDAPGEKAGGEGAESGVERAERVEVEKLRARRAELAELEAAREEGKAALEAAKAAMAALEAARPAAEARLAAAEAETQALQRTHAVRQKALQLLADEAAAAQMVERTEQKKAQLAQLKADCEAEQAPLDEELRKLEQALQARREGATAKIRLMRELQASMRAMVEQLQLRDEMSARLSLELERQPKGQSRSSYTRRIMDIVKSLRKQKVDIEKILTDVRESQKEVNSASETLSRSFAAADEIIYRAAVHEEASKQCYKGLAKLHETFGLLGESVQEIGNVRNAIRDLQTKTDELALRNTAEAIERMGADLKELKEQNAKLSAQ
ncbi:hypothetical protein AB1Y20_011282 [Prymnesium parvum]|uniref:Coiled-coil domain-containing protein 22 homolog n=1 Tax=Prymnesium parvum TaxID=97485 RepID=A0AB34ILF8_PRYPA